MTYKMYEKFCQFKNATLFHCTFPTKYVSYKVSFLSILKSIFQSTRKILGGQKKTELGRLEQMTSFKVLKAKFELYISICLTVYGY